MILTYNPPTCPPPEAANKDTEGPAHRGHHPLVLSPVLQAAPGPRERGPGSMSHGLPTCSPFISVTPPWLSERWAVRPEEDPEDRKAQRWERRWPRRRPEDRQGQLPPRPRWPEHPISSESGHPPARAVRPASHVTGRDRSGLPVLRPVLVLLVSLCPFPACDGKHHAGRTGYCGSCSVR